jgi:DNA-binding response OmpR family regulator
VTVGQSGYAGRDAMMLPSVMLLDLQLPRIDGLEIDRLRRVRDGRASARAVLVAVE